MLIEDCSCGSDHEEMPMVDIALCPCVPWDKATWIKYCDHPVMWVPGVCLEHKRHVPCRKCIYSVDK